MSLRTRLILLVAMATLVPAALLGIRFYQERGAQIELAVAALSLQAKIIANDLDEKIQGTAQLHFGLGRAVDLDSSNRAACSAFLSSVREEYPQYTGILTISPEGKLVCDSLQTGRELDLRDREYFKAALMTRDAVTLQPVFGRLTGISVLQIAYPARSASEHLKFVLLASLNLQSFTERHRQRLSAGMDILLLGKDGVVLVPAQGPNWSALTGTSIAKTNLFRFATSQNVERTEQVVGIDGRDHFWAAASTPGIRDAGLYVMVGISKAMLVGAADKRLYEELFVVAMVSLLLSAGVWTLAEIGVRRPISGIAVMAKKLGSGDLTVRIAAPYPGGELGGLVTELNLAADSLQRQHSAVDDLNQKLYQSQQLEARAKMFLDTIIEHIPNSIVVKAADSTQDVRDWKLTLVNKAYEDLTGLSREKLIGKSVRELYSGDVADIMAASDEDALRSNPVVVASEFPLVTDEKDPRVVTLRKVAIRSEDGKAQYMLTVLDDVTEMRRSAKRIAHMAHYDTLTNLPNRAAFNGRFAATLEKAAANGERFTILSIDLDRVKETNDVYGHSAGDALLQEGARRLEAAAAGAFIARIGGDEFTLIVTEGKQPAAAAVVADRLLAAFVEDFMIEGKSVQIGLGIGGAVYPTDGADAKTLMVNADTALYRAKAEPQASVVFFRSEMGVLRQERHDLQEDLRLAIDRGELRLHYQPQFRITGEVVGFEALARWESPSRGLVPPGTFIPIAEEYSLISPLGEWALREACREAATWPRPLTVAVNVSPIQFHHGDLPGTVHSILLETGLAPARLTLEITEGVLINDFYRALSILCKLKSMGVQIALDDFGNGYSSLSYLHSFAFDKIKIDRTFIFDLEQNRHSRAIVHAVIGLAHNLGIPILAEGVETKLQHAFLSQEGCDEVQGYLVGRPFPISHYVNLIDRQTTGRQNPFELAS